MCKKGDSDTKWTSFCLSKGYEFFMTTALLDTVFSPSDAHIMTW